MLSAGTMLVSLPSHVACGLHMNGKDKGLGRSFPLYPASLHLSGHGDRAVLSPSLVPCPYSSPSGLPTPILSTLCFARMEGQEKESTSTFGCG